MEGKEEKEEKEEKKSNFWKHRVKLVLKKNFRGHKMNRKKIENFVASVQHPPPWHPQVNF